jgi:hypothetical protein
LQIAEEDIIVVPNITGDNGCRWQTRVCFVGRLIRHGNYEYGDLWYSCR